MVEIKFSELLMKKFGRHVLIHKFLWNKASEIYYKVDWRTTRIENLRDWFNACVDDVLKDESYAEKLRFFKSIKKSDDRATAILRYVHRTTEYKSDKKVWFVTEKWQTPLETWLLKTGDCEDGALLIAAFLKHSGVPSEQWGVVCGDVKSGGHCWTNYTSNSNAVTYHLDWCYWFNSNSIPNRNPFHSDSNYVRTWFGFNDKKGWRSISNPNKKFR